MFSGKTTELLRRAALLPAESRLAIKHVTDHRYRESAIVCHSGAFLEANRVTEAREILKLVQPDHRFVAIDEAHFFGEALVDAVQSLVALGTELVLTSLDRDSWGRPFPVAVRLAELADHSEYLNAKCVRCTAPANRTQRLTPIVSGNMVGGLESYEARCESCWCPPATLSQPFAQKFGEATAH